jgi:hypothetical protein
MTPSERKIAWAFFSVVSALAPYSPEREALLDVAYTIAPRDDVEEFMLACGFEDRAD